MSFIGELKRRNVIRVAILYFVSSWLLLQLTDVLSSLLPVPEWTGSFVFMMLLIGLAPALIFAWVYEMTPEGLKRERDVDPTSSITPDHSEEDQQCDRRFAGPCDCRHGCRSYAAGAGAPGGRRCGSR